jgi:flagellar basal body-associated protein FliL
MKKNNEKKTFIVLMLILCFILLLTGLAYKYRRELNFKQRAIEVKKLLITSRRIGIKFNVTTDVGDQCVKIQFYVPCKSLKEKQKISKSITRIRHEMLMSLSLPENINSIKKRDFSGIKANCLKIVNKYSPELVKKVYLDLFIIE